MSEVLDLEKVSLDANPVIQKMSENEHEQVDEDFAG